MTELLRTENLSKSYRRRKVVNRVSIVVRAGEIVGLLGPNGAGKTTSFRMVVGMITPDEGRVVFASQDVTRMPMYRRARRGMGYLSQEPSVFRKMTVIDNVLAVLEARRVPAGERRRLEISRALATKPSLLLLDEPFAGVDPITVEEIQKILGDLSSRGIAILITDHAVAETLRISDRAYILDQGEVIAEGEPQDVISNERVRRVYLGRSFGEGITEEEERELELD